MRRRRPARFAASAMSRAERLTPAAGLGLLASLLGAPQHRLPGRSGLAVAERRHGQPLGLVPQLAPWLAQQQARKLDVPGGKAGGGGDLIRLCSARSVALERGFDRLDRQRHEIDRLAA